MRGWNKLIILGALFSAILIISAVFSTGAVDVLMLSLGGSPASPAGAPESSSPEVLVDPNTTVKDYVNDPGYQIGDTFEVHVNVTGATDLYAWQVNMTWDPSNLNVSDIIAGEFLNVGAAPNYTTSSPAPNGLGFVINKTDNATGYTALGESILGADTGVIGSGRLVTIEFQVVGYGYTNFTISVGGILPTTLLNSTLSSMAFDTYVYRDMNGWFDNRVTGDADSGGVVSIGDMAVVNNAWVTGYVRFADCNDDGAISIGDLGKINANWGRFKP